MQRSQLKKYKKSNKSNKKLANKKKNINKKINTFNEECPRIVVVTTTLNKSINQSTLRGT